MSRAFMRKRNTFRPTDIGGCTLWLDGADPAGTGVAPVAGSTITTWADKSTSANNATAYGTVTVNTLVNGKLAILTTASSGFFGYLTNSTTTATTFVVATYVNANAYNRLFAVSSGTLTEYNNPGVALFACAINGASMGPFYNSQNVTPVTSGPITQNQPFIMTTLFTGTQCRVNLNGISTTTSPVNISTSFSYTYYGIGTHANGFGSVGECWNGIIAEVIHYQAALSLQNYQQVEGYLSQKWGLRQQIPQSHPGTTGIVYSQQSIPKALSLPYPVIFTPLQIQTGSCQLWLDGADPAGTGIVPANGTVLTSWIDKSGKSKNATGVNSPTVVTSGVNSLSVVSYNGSSYSYSSIAAGSFSSGMVIFIVYKVNGAVTYCAPITRTIGNMGYPIDQYNSVRYMGGPGGIAGGGSSWSHASATNTTLFTQIILTSGNILSEYVNGTSATVTGAFPYSDTASFIYIGTRDDKVTSFNGYMCEAIVYNAVFTTPQQQQVEGYLAWKWGLQANLPANHPYKSSTPDIKNARGISRPVGLPVRSNASIATPNTRLFTVTFTYTGTFQSFTVPSTISPRSVNIYMWGAGGGTSQTYSGYVNYNGGAGAMVQGVYTVTPGSTLYIVVGLGGSTVQSAQTDAQGGGGGVNAYGGGGGGRSAIQLTAGGADVVVAGGGGGGGLLASNNNGTGGPSYYSGTSPATLAGLPAYGGSQTAGGAGTSSPGAVTGGSGSLKFGGTGTNNSCSGGGGYYGGGGSGNGEPGWDPGAGGSSLIDNLTLIPGQSVFGYNSTNLYGAPNTGSPYYQSNIAAGGIGGNATGGNGLVVITYYA